MKIQGQKLLNALTILSNIDSNAKIWIMESGIQLEVIDPLKMAMARVMIKKDDMLGFKTDITGVFKCDISEIRDEVKISPSGDVYIQMKNESSMILSTKFYTTEYELIKLEETKLKGVKTNVLDISIPFPEEAVAFLKMIKMREIERIAMRQSDTKLTVFGKGKRKYSHDIKVMKPPVSFGSTAVNTLWFVDVLNSLGDQVSFCFTSMGNVHLLSWSHGFCAIATLAGSMKKIIMPGDVPRINKEEIDEDTSDYEW